MNEFNGYTNWETWEAFNLLTSYDQIYKLAKASAPHDIDYIVMLIDESLAKAGLEGDDAFNHINTNNINFIELTDSLKDC